MERNPWVHAHPLYYIVLLVESSPSFYFQNRMTSFVLQDKAYIEASNNSAYNFGTGPFTIEAWVHSTSYGPLVTRKPTAGGSGKKIRDV